jgi:hypothetical protein
MSQRRQDYIVEIDGVRTPAQPTQEVRAASHLRGRPWLAVHWRCCSVYSRVYRKPDESSYRGYCPKCARPVRIRVGPGGSNHKFFEAW